MAPLLLGRIVTLPVAILFGPWYGALAALIHAISGRGIFTVGLRVLPLEAIVIGLFARSGRSPILGGLLVWSVLAATLIAVPSYYGVGYLHDTILPVALQLVVSGLMAVVLADLIATGAIGGGWSSPTNAPCASCAATPSTPSCSPPPCRCWSSPRSTASCRRRNRKSTVAIACTKRCRRSTSTSAPTSTITSTRCSRWPRR